MNVKDILDFFIKIIDRVKIKFVFFLLFILSIILLFFPEVQSEIIGEFEIPTEWKFFLYIIFLISLISIVVYIPITVFRKISKVKNNVKRKIVNSLKSLSDDENKFIVETFYDESERKFRSVGEASLSSGYFLLLSKKHIILQNNHHLFDLDGCMTDVVIQPFVLQYLNSRLKWKLIKIKNGKLIFSFLCL